MTQAIVLTSVSFVRRKSMKCEFIRGNVNEWNEWCEIRLDGKQVAYGHDFSETPEAVSYTHLTLPTSDLV